MPEFRKDPVTGRWVIIATERAKRPAAFVVQKQARKDEYCPFCAGGENHTPDEVLAYRDDGTSPNTPGWWLRVVPNKYPALVADGRAKRSGDGMYDRISGMGVHEVVIETPHHNLHIGDMPVKQVEEILWAYRDRTVEMAKDPGLRYVMIFKNHLQEAGASLDHPHSQIIAMPIVPKRVLEEIEGAKLYHDYKERCVFCDMIAQEIKDRERLIMETDHFVAFAPYASRFPFETHILPKEHASFFHDIQKNEVADFAHILKEVCHRLKEVLEDPPFNWMLHTTPLRDPETPHYHWHMEIIPKLTRQAGFEWGTGFYINPFSPEGVAKALSSEREAEVLDLTQEQGA